MKDNIINFIEFGKIVGLINLYCFYFKKWTLYRLPITLPIFGIIRLKEELLNIRDNILQGSIRDRGVETYIKEAKEPVIVDCGVNVGVTVRWWFYLNRRANVYGIDMMKEANDFTLNALADVFKTKFVPITAVLTSRTGGATKLSYNDPLFGGNRVGISSEHSERRDVRSMTLDDCLRGCHVDTIDLLKVDIEGYATSMFHGAIETLAKVKNIFLEIHSKEEEGGCVNLLQKEGFRVRRSYKRHMWLDRPVKK